MVITNDYPSGIRTKADCIKFVCFDLWTSFTSVNRLKKLLNVLRIGLIKETKSIELSLFLGPGNEDDLSNPKRIFVLSRLAFSVDFARLIQ